MYCAVCDPHHQLKYCGNTINLFSHLRNKHPRLYAELQTPVKPTTNSDRQSTMPTINSMFAKQEKYRPDSTRLKELTKAVGYFVTKDMMPLNVVHSKGFCHLVEKLEPRFNIPSHKTLTEKIIPTMSIDLKQSHIIPSIKKVTYVALTTDCWTSRNNASYIGLTIHFLTPDWQLEHFVLENKELPINHTADNLVEALGECLSD